MKDILNDRPHEGFDIIGDVHGDADRLKKLLLKLDYRLTDGIWSHPDGRRVIYVGDLIDRGPKVRETLEIARGMVEAGSALMVIGNHEFNLLSLHIADGHGGYLRPRTERNLKSCRASLAEFAGREEELASHLAWFRTLPLHLEVGGLRVIHAEWHAGFVAGLKGNELLGDNFLRLANLKGTREHRLISVLLKGSEASLPPGVTFHDHDGIERTEVRLCWPLSAKGLRYPAVALESDLAIPDLPITDEIIAAMPGYGPDEPPVVFGHYAIKDRPHGIITPNAACLDHGCGKGGRLVAYRWNGERPLVPGNLIFA